MNCPLCVDQQLEITHRAGIEIDICPQCRGIWLDRGELDRLASAPTPPTPASANHDPGAGYRGDDRYDRRDDRYDDDRRYDGRRSPKKSKKRRLADRLGDALEEVLDL